MLTCIKFTAGVFKVIWTCQRHVSRLPGRKVVYVKGFRSDIYVPINTSASNKNEHRFQYFFLCKTHVEPSYLRHSLRTPPSSRWWRQSRRTPEESSPPPPGRRRWARPQRAPGPAGWREPPRWSSRWSDSLATSARDHRTQVIDLLMVVVVGRGCCCVSRALPS